MITPDRILGKPGGAARARRLALLLVFQRAGDTGLTKQGAREAVNAVNTSGSGDLNILAFHGWIARCGTMRTHCSKNGSVQRVYLWKLTNAGRSAIESVREMQ